MNTITEEEALNRMAAYCSAAEHCKAEVNEKLQKWGLPYEVINRDHRSSCCRSLLMKNVIVERLSTISSVLPNGVK